MSRIGNAPIPVPTGVDVTIAGRHVTVKGPKGTLERDIPGEITVRQDDDELLVERPDDERENRAMHGLVRSLVNNMVVGVTDGFRKELEIVGVGYRATAQGPSKLELALGFSHPVDGRGPRRHHLRGPRAHPHRGQRHRQGARRPGRRQHPQAPQARALQGQGRALRRRARAPQGRQDRRSRHHELQRQAEARRPASAATSGSARRSGAPPSGPAWPCSAPTATSPPR